MRRIHIITIVVLAALTVASASFAVYYRQKYEGLKTNPQTLAQESVSGLISDVSKLMQLPDEPPTVATVSDPSKLKDQVFFQDAKTGDKVLIYTDAKKAILYDPVAKKIVEVAPLYMNNQPAATATGAAIK